MGLEELRARLDRLLSTSPDRRAQASGLHDALVELKVATAENRDALAAAERELVTEREHLANAERRGKLAAGIGDAETERIAGVYASKHQERIGLLERKIAVIRDELAFIEREYQSMAAQLKQARTGVDPLPVPDPLEQSEREFDALRYNAERAAREEAARQQLEALKKKLGKQ